MTEKTKWPQKTHELHSHHFDSTIWNDFRFRNDDIVIATYAKSGTTWMQQIIAQMLFGPDAELEVAEMSPWLDLRVPPKAVKLPLVEAQTHRRFLKTHLRVDALVFSPKAKYIYIGRVGPPIGPPPPDVRQYWHEWLDGDGYPFWSFWDSVRTWWEIRSLQNVLFVHYSNLKRDLAGQMRRMAAFLDIPVDESNWTTIVEFCSFDWMKQHATKSVPLAGAFWDAGAQVFINQGKNGRWTDVLSVMERAEYEDLAVQKLGSECARWLATGEGPTGKPGY